MHSTAAVWAGWVGFVCFVVAVVVVVVFVVVVFFGGGSPHAAMVVDDFVHVAHAHPACLAHHHRRGLVVPAPTVGYSVTWLGQKGALVG